MSKVNYNIFGNDGLLRSWINGIGIYDQAGNLREIREGDFTIDQTGNRVPILREDTLSLGMRTSAAIMTAIYSYNHTLLNNPKIVIMGSSTAAGYGLPADQTIQYKLQQYAIANWGGATINNIAVPGQWSTNWKPTAQGGTVGSNIDAALAYQPDFILMMGPTNNAEHMEVDWLADLQEIIQHAQERGVRMILMSPMPRTPFDLTQQQFLADAAAAQLAALPYLMFDTFNSDVRLKNTGNPAEGNPIYFQPDGFHLNDLGTTYVTDNFIIPFIENQFRANTAYLNFIIEKSPNISTGWAVFDTITDQQVTRKAYPKEVGYYRATATLKDGSTLAYSNVHQVTNESPIADAGPDLNPAAGTASVDITGGGVDPDGTITGYLWEIVAGTGITLQNANTPTVTVNGLADGQSYTLSLTVTDNNGATGSDTVGITVGAASGTELLFNFSESTTVAGYANMTGSPNETGGAVRSATQGGITVGTVSTGTAYWGVFGTNASDVNGEDTPNPTFALSPEATRSYLFTYNTSFNGSNYNIRISGFTPGEVVPEIAILASRDAAGVSAATRLIDINVLDANGNDLLHDFDVKGNTANLATFLNKVANASGEIFVAVHRRLPLDGTHEFAYINAMRITRNI